MPEEMTNAPVPSAEETASAGHSYDGIQEYDNPTPLWWELLFAASIMFAPLYIIWFHMPGTSRTLGERYETNLAANMRLQFGEIGDLTADEPTILTYMDDEKWLKVGESTFATHCVSCHGREGEGVSAPNLTDDYYLHVKGVADIANVVINGAKNGAMPAWGNRLHPNEVVLVSSYVAALRGQDLPSKYQADKGKVIEPWPAPPDEPEAEAETIDQASLATGSEAITR